MRFERIKLYGFKDKNRIIDVSFSDEAVTIIYGENGSGKTSLLKVLHAILVKDEQTLINENISVIELYVSENGESRRITIERNYDYEDLDGVRKEYLVEDEDPFARKYKIINNGLIQKYNWKNYDDSKIKDVSSILFGVNRGITNTVNVLPEQIEDFFMNTSLGRRYRIMERRELTSLSEQLADFLNRQHKFRIGSYSNRKKVSKLSSKNSILDKLDMETIEELIYNRYRLANLKKIERVQNALFETLSYAIYSGESENNKIHDIPQNFHDLLIENRDKLLEALRDTGDNMLQKNIIDILERNNIPRIINECKNNELLLSLLVKMIQELKEEEAILESINTLETIFNSQIVSKKKLVVNKDGVIIKFNSEENTHGLNGLSSGEKHLLSFLTIFLIEGNHRDILMIDEPELSLNIKWQREILNILQKVAPDSQIIVASHSAIIGRNHTNYLVKLD
ncbi:AAA family ATPase [Clostridium swellfunianum]|uniref:AAA family ATPase n=1 Tax=Clostridium swellfunianum TaxID=1367462 RepID=UPI00202ED760|nr:AAA family ATPase [Clostridium swellfunianum]MCM0647252.1 AAA family ATPase [Clostridium swellfunianum]